MSEIKNTEKESTHINEFCRECGFFNSDTKINNGYGCDHPEQELSENGQGKCYPFSCPLAHQSDEHPDLVIKKDPQGGDSL